MRWIVLLAACEGVLPGVDWQQMIHQHKFQAFEECSFFADGRAMQLPPPGTIPRTSAKPLEAAFAKGAYLDHFAIPLTSQTFIVGRAGFETYCAACHGVDGSGQSEVARNMELRKPPSLLDDRVRNFPPGRIFQVASEGYGLMPAYSVELSPEQLWAVTAYLAALQRSQSVKLDDLPADLRTRALDALRSGHED